MILLWEWKKRELYPQPQVYLKECKYRIKKRKMPEFIDSKLESDSRSDSE